jgi:two-component system sensor histidine kinase YesM
MKEHMESNIKGTLLQIQDNIIYKQEILQSISDTIYNDRELQKRFSTTYDKMFQKTKAVEEIMNDGNLFQEVEKDIRISIYTANTTLPEVYFSNPLDEYFELNGFNIYHLSRIKNEQWYNDLQENNLIRNWKVLYSNKQEKYISLIRNQVNFTSLTKMGVIKIDIKVKDFFSAVDYQKIGSNGSLMILDNDNNILTYSLPEGKNARDMLQSEKGYLKIEQPITNSTWQLVALIPVNELYENAKSLLNLTILLCFIIVFILILVSVFLSKVLSSNVNRIIYGIKMFEKGHFSYRVEEKGDNEFNEIIIVLNNMAQTIETLIHEVYVTKLQRKEIELQLLQAQINPHFLYNTLSSISRLAKLGKVDELHLMIMALAKFYRLTLNEGRMVISINDEIEQIKAYITIQNIQFGDRLKVSYELDETILPSETIKFIMQPFVENILEHAWHQETMHIWIKVYNENDNIIISITDNGIGMAHETIEQVLADGESRKGYGIYNVDKRIKLQFGDTYGVRISSILEQGTTVQLVLPNN